MGRHLAYDPVDVHLQTIPVRPSSKQSPYGKKIRPRKIKKWSLYWKENMSQEDKNSGLLIRVYYTTT